MSRIFLLLLLAGITCSCTVRETEEEINSHIEAVERGLLPSVVLDGEPVPFFTLPERMRHYRVPAVSIAFIRNGEIQWTRAYGYLSSDSTREADQETMFQAASISKPVATTGLLAMVEDSILKLDENVNHYLEGWSIRKSRFMGDSAVTLEKLITHTAGLTVHGFRGYANGEPVPGPIEILNGSSPANSGPIMVEAQPGTRWKYSGGGFVVMQKAVEDVTGTPFHELMKKHVLEPLGMTRSTYRQPLPESFGTNYAQPYRGDGTPVNGGPHTYPEMAAAGLWTTPTDLARYAIELQQSLERNANHVLSPSMTRNMLTSRMGNWGLGIGLIGQGDSLIFTHGGANEGYRCLMFAFANLGEGVVIMTNSDNGNMLYQEIMRSISREYKWYTHKPVRRTTIEMGEEQLEEFVGSYMYTPEYILEFYLKDGELWIYQPWDQYRGRLYPESADVFFTTEENTTLEIQRNEQGEILGAVADGYIQLRKVE